MTNNYYPTHDNLKDQLYYVEFDRSKKNTFTLFMRSFLPSHVGGGEVHPYNLFTGEYYDYSGAIPDHKFVEFMVDALNEKAAKQ